MNPLLFDPADEGYVSLATYRRNGNEVRTPVWIAKVEDYFYVFSEGTAGKVKRIRANGRARLAACTSRGYIRSDWLESRARIVTEAGVIEAAYRALRNKYGWKMQLVDVFSKLIGRYNKRVIIELQIAQDG